MRWVQRYVPEFEKHWQRYARSLGASWRINETYIKIKGRWGYLYCGVDNKRQTIDFFLSEQRNIAAAKQFLQQTIEKRGVPQKISRTNRYLNNVIEQDHRCVKQRVRPMLGFKRFDHATIMITGTELVHQIRKGQFDVAAFCSSTMRTPQV
jgi:transposase-like protein